MRPMLVAALCLAAPALANDGFGGLTATGLTFSQTDAVAMETEDLFIGLDRIAVDYQFRNITSQDVTGEVVFPLPPISLWGQLESAWNLPDPVEGNLLNFTATVEGTPVPVTIDMRAVIEEPWEENRPLGAQYDTPGRDVTADLERLGIPLSVDAAAVADFLVALDDGAKAELVSLGLAEFNDGSNGGPVDAYPYWSIVVRYHWTQTFPAGAVVRVHHEYDNRPPGGIFDWSDPPPDYMLDVAERYCVDAGTSRALARTMEAAIAKNEVPVAYYPSYVLRTASSWAGPIGRFRLTIDKGRPENVLSLCIDGIEKTGPTTFVVEKTDFVPDRDLEMLVLVRIVN